MELIRTKKWQSIHQVAVIISNMVTISIINIQSTKIIPESSSMNQSLVSSPSYHYHHHRYHYHSVKGEMIIRPIVLLMASFLESLRVRSGALSLVQIVEWHHLNQFFCPCSLPRLAATVCELSAVNLVNRVKLKRKRPQQLEWNRSQRRIHFSKLGQVRFFYE